MNNNQNLNSENTSPELSKKNKNAWLVRLSDEVRIDGYALSIDFDSPTLHGIENEDAMLITEELDGKFSVLGIGRVFRKRFSLENTFFYFDGYVTVSPTITLDELTVPVPKNSAPINRLDWSLFEEVLKKTTKMKWSVFPVIKGETSHEQAYVRELLQTAMKDDLLGPADGPFEEIVGMSVRDRYLVGKLAPRSPSGQSSDPFCQREGNPDEEDGQVPKDLIPYVNSDDVSREKVAPLDAEDEEDEKDIDVKDNQSLFPSSFGFTFCVDSKVDKFELIVKWGFYKRTESDRIDEEKEKPFLCWKRVPSGGSVIIPMTKQNIEPIAIDNQCPDVLVKGSINESLENDFRIVTIFLVNNQLMPKQNQDEAWVFQPELIVKDPENHRIFRKKPLLNSGDLDDERRALEMLYRKKVEFSVGHGVSVHATTLENDPEHAVEIRTTMLPEIEVPVTQTAGLADEDRQAMKHMIAEGFLDMKNLAELDKEALVSGLKILTKDYTLWINEQRERIGKDVLGYDDTAFSTMDRCSKICKRLEEGINTLSSSEYALEAFRFANRAMAMQRIHSIYSLRKRRGEDPDIADVDTRENRSWYPFQLAFMLLSLPSLANPEHEDRSKPLEEYVDLLWFPTGGGKTEAYLGVAAFTMAIRRLQGDLGGLDGTRGLAVIMRYTLRLLTIQQFQRASTLICALESMRREDPKKWGTIPFTIGLWVGNRVTPAKTKDAHQSIESIREGKLYGGNSPAQLTTCPWCGSEISAGRDIEVNRDIGRTFIYCGDKFGNCDFGRRKSKNMGIPVLVVDDEIYRHPPTMLIATVDKFAMMAWRGQIRTLFGQATEECERHGLLWPNADCKGKHPKKGSLPKVTVKDINPIRPPDLIIQDEFHLISGPLGTMVGLYETAVDELSTWSVGDKSIRPKVIASTATVRKANEQVKNVFFRKVVVFPPHGLDIEDNYFSVQRPIKDNPGRLYMGVCSPGSSRPAVSIRIYAAMLSAAQALFERFGQVVDPYMTIVGYFNSKRELGGMRRLAEDDVQTRAYRVKMSNVSRPGLEQRSLRNVNELTSRTSSEDIPKMLDQLEVKFKETLDENGKYVTKWEKGETQAIDILLATNMLSVGVDISRLGIMAVHGQPKNTAEYIQATSRVGRSFPGLICSVLTWSKPRDLSHYETFEHYHATFYKHVEAQSVTPFASRSLDRGLTGVLISLMRLRYLKLNPNLGAMELNNVASSELKKMKEIISNRVWKATNEKSIKENLEDMILERGDYWVQESGKPGRRLGYETEKRQGDIVALLKKPASDAWDKYTVPMSMREVEREVKLIMDDSFLQEKSPAWERSKVQNNDGDDV